MVVVSYERGTPVTTVRARQAAGPDIGAGALGGGGRGAETPDGKGLSTLSPRTPHYIPNRKGCFNPPPEALHPEPFILSPTP